MLMVGCGSSNLSDLMWEDGWRDMTSIDFSDVAIEAGKQRTKDRPGMQWRCMDATSMTFSPRSFDVILDKGLLDALLLGEWPQAEESLTRLGASVNEVLRSDGCWVVFSLSGPRTILPVLGPMLQRNWEIESMIVHRLEYAYLYRITKRDALANFRSSWSHSEAELR